MLDFDSPTYRPPERPRSGRPPLSRECGTMRPGISFTQDQWDAVVIRAEAESRSAAAVVRTAVLRYLGTPLNTECSQSVWESL